MGLTNFGPDAFLNVDGPMAFICGPIEGWDLQQGGEPWPDGKAPDAMQIAVELAYRGRVFATGGPGEILHAPDPGPWGLALRITDRRVARAATGRLVTATGTKTYPGRSDPFPDSELVWTEQVRFARIHLRPSRDRPGRQDANQNGGIVLGASAAVLAGLVKRRNLLANPDRTET